MWSGVKCVSSSLSYLVFVTFPPEATAPLAVEWRWLYEVIQNKALKPTMCLSPSTTVL